MNPDQVRHIQQKIVLVQDMLKELAKITTKKPVDAIAVDRYLAKVIERLTQLRSEVS